MEDFNIFSNNMKICLFWFLTSSWDWLEWTRQGSDGDMQEAGGRGCELNVKEMAKEELEENIVMANYKEMKEDLEKCEKLKDVRSLKNI